MCGVRLSVLHTSTLLPPLAPRPLRRFSATMEALTPVRCYITERLARVWSDSAVAPGFHLECLMCRSNSRRPPCLTSAHGSPCLTHSTVQTIPSPTTWSAPGIALSRYVLPLSVPGLPVAFQLSFRAYFPQGSRLRQSPAGSPDTPGRNGFVILRTGRSPPVALHPASRRRSYSRLQAVAQAWRGLSPLWSGTLTGALGRPVAAVGSARDNSDWRAWPALWAIVCQPLDSQRGSGGSQNGISRAEIPAE